MKTVLLFSIFVYTIASVNFVEAQTKNDYVWILGYPPNNSQNHSGGVIMDFNSNIPLPEYFNTLCWASEPSVLSTSKGILQAYSNGCSIYNANHEVMQGGDSISYGRIWDNYCDYGYPGFQNNLVLPWPGDTTKAIVFHVKIDDNFTPHYLLYSIVEFSEDFPLGIVTEKNKLLLSPGQSSLITATRHGNGRDWWIVFPEDASNRFFKILIDQENVTVVDTQSIGVPWNVSYSKSQAIFSSDGSKYIRFNPWKGLDVFDFDRCSGVLSNPLESGPLSDPVIEVGGVAASVDSRFVYVANRTYLYQYDLQAQDVLASRILIDEYDGYEDPLATTFYQMALGPDGKIYGFATNSPRSLHIIHHPERQGNACTFRQHDMQLPAFVDIGSINMVSYRLGPADNSLCDTLGINNEPIADFRYEIDSLFPYSVHFNNLSYFLPDTYAWDFGNATGSSLEDPGMISYTSFGTYKVCLTVSNEYGQDSFCRTIELKDSITGESHPSQDPLIRVYPSLFQTELFVEVPESIPALSFHLYSSIGAMILERTFNAGLSKIMVPDLPRGVYFYSVTQDQKKIVKSGRLVKN